jgi:hypothetical protein
VRSDSFHRQNVLRLAGYSCKRELTTWFSLPLMEFRLYIDLRAAFDLQG